MENPLSKGFFNTFKMKLNKEWHLHHIMPKNPTFEQRLEWHREHKKNCACRPVPEKLMSEMKRRGIKF
jgi:hypothetical protein